MLGVKFEPESVTVLPPTTVAGEGVNVALDGGVGHGSVGVGPDVGVDVGLEVGVDVGRGVEPDVGVDLGVGEEPGRGVDLGVAVERGPALGVLPATGVG